MEKIIKKAENAYYARETAKAEMQELKRDAEKEQEEFEKEWNKLGKLIEKDKQVKDFIKTQEESKGGPAGAGAATGGGTEKSDPKTQKTENINELTNTEKILRKNTAQVGFGIAKEAASI